MSASSRIYEDILACRRQEVSNFMWASRDISPKLAYAQSLKPTPETHKDEVLKSPKIQELLLTLSEQQNVAKSVLEGQVRSILDEIGYNKKLKVIRWLGFVLAKICTRICTGIYVNKQGISQLKSQIGDCPVIFVPSHRSYADFILMSYICFNEDVAIPAIAAGMDFHGMWGMGTVLRDTGAFFMRRSYNNDHLYWTTFKQYVHQIVAKGDLPVEFFIEGTRSRSNKSLTPKYGLILMILKAFFLTQVPDILFVPINISYDRILEEKLFAFELLGIPKPKESTSGFFKSLSIIKEKYGSIYVHFAEPISAKSFFSADRSVHSLKPIHQQEITDEEKKLIPALAHEIVHRQQKHATITIFNLLAIILNNNLYSGNSLLTVDAALDEILWLKDVIEMLGGFVEPGDVRGNFLQAMEVHKNIVSVNELGELSLVWNKVVLDKNSLGKLKGHELSEKTLEICVPFVMLQIYINPVLHHLVDVAIIVVVLKHKEIGNEDELFGHYHFLRALLSQEFVSFGAREKLDFDAALKHAISLKLVQNNGGLYKIGDNEKCENVIYNCIDGFIFTYYVVCMVLLKVGAATIDEKSVLKQVQAEVEARINKENDFVHPYSLSLDTITNCLNALSLQRILHKSRRESAVFYEINTGELLSLKMRIEEYMLPEQILQKKKQSVQLHLKNKL